MTVSNERPKSLWQPPSGSISPETEVFINVFHDSFRAALDNGINSTTSSSLSEKETLAIRSLQERTDIVIHPADKGSAIVFQDTEAYHKEIARQLSDMKFYKRLNRNPTEKHQDQVKKVVSRLQQLNVIDRNRASNLIEAKVRPQHFCTLPKIHKSLQDPPGRPIVSSNCAPTERISAFGDFHLKPLAVTLPSYITHTKDFL